MAQLLLITSPAPHIPVFNDDTPSPPLPPKALDTLNHDTALKVAFAGFLRTKEVTCEASDMENQEVFEATKLQRRDTTFADDGNHVILNLRSSKSDLQHTGVEIVLAKTGTPTCPVEALESLFALDPQPGRAPLFRTSIGTLSRDRYIANLRSKLRARGIRNWNLFSGHSPRRGAAQHASDNGIMDFDIQRLGRWSSEAFRGYFHVSIRHKYALNRRFQTGRAAPIVQISPNHA